MNEQEVRAMFLLADIPVIGLRKVDNGYWPKDPEFQERRDKEPWWIVDIGRGSIEIGNRKSVVEIEWCNTGIVFPFIPHDGHDNFSDKHIIKDVNTTVWETGCHSRGYGGAVSTLTALRKTFSRHDFLKAYWAEHPVAEEDKKEWIIVGMKAHWENIMVERIEVIIKAANPTFALQEFYEKYPSHRKIVLGLKEEIEFRRLRLQLCQ